MKKINAKKSLSKADVKQLEAGELATATGGAPFYPGLINGIPLDDLINLGNLFGGNINWGDLINGIPQQPF